MTLLSRTTSIIIASAMFGVGGASFALSTWRGLDDCPRLLEHPNRWQQVRDEWRQDNLVAMIRHATDCDPDEVPGCVNGNETLTAVGEAQARAIGAGVHRTLGGDYTVHHSFLDRTHATAALAFGDSIEDPNITKPCEDTIQDYVESFDYQGNQFFVTHSSCFNAMSNEDGDRLLGFSAAKDRNFGIAAFFRRVDNGPDELLGCAWPVDWAKLPEPEVSLTSR